jgi:hypothetical protein
MGNEGLVDGAEVEFLKIANLVIVTMLSFVLGRSYDYSMHNMNHALSRTIDNQLDLSTHFIPTFYWDVEINHRLLASLLVRHG